MPRYTEQSITCPSTRAVKRSGRSGTPVRRTHTSSDRLTSSAFSTLKRPSSPSPILDNTLSDLHSGLCFTPTNEENNKIPTKWQTGMSSPLSDSYNKQCVPTLSYGLMITWSRVFALFNLSRHASTSRYPTRQGYKTTVANGYYNSWSLVIGLIIIIAFSTAAWFLSPKGDNQT